MVSFRSPFTSLNDLELFSIDGDSAQLLVRSSSPTVTATHEQTAAAAATCGGVAAITMSDLEPDTSYEFTVETDSGSILGTISGRTRPDAGPVLSRIATISDVHLGLDEFGVGRKLSEDASVEPYPLRCAQAAIREATDWGADVLLIKGDLTESGKTEQWEQAGELLSSVEIPVLLTAGNHDVWKTSEVRPAGGARSIGLPYGLVQELQLPGVRIVLADTSQHGRGTGDLARSRDALLQAVDCTDPVLLAFHHNIQRAPITWFWPAGVSSRNAMPVVAALEEVNPRLFLSSGHTHRNRVHWLGRHATLPYTEVSSTSDYPGVWAGYEVTATTIRQSVRRIASPEAVGWTERTRAVLGGVWPRWSQGRLDDRCVDFEFAAHTEQLR